MSAIDRIHKQEKFFQALQSSHDDTYSEGYQAYVLAQDILSRPPNSEHQPLDPILVTNVIDNSNDTAATNN